MLKPMTPLERFILKWDGIFMIPWVVIAILYGIKDGVWNGFRAFLIFVVMNQIVIYLMFRRLIHEAIRLRKKMP